MYTTIDISGFIDSSVPYLMVFTVLHLDKAMNDSLVYYVPKFYFTNANNASVICLMRLAGPPRPRAVRRLVLSSQLTFTM